MAPSRTIILNENNCDLKYIERCSCRPNMNTQIVIYFDNRRLIWNFNAEKLDDTMGKCTNKQLWMIETGCEVNKWYKRRAYTDPFPQVIIEQMYQSEIDEYINSQIHSENDSRNDNTSNFSLSSNPQDITMTFEN